MPVTVKKLKSGRYRVATPSGTKAKSTTKRNAMIQKSIIERSDKKKKGGH
jgi:hypothetical protein